MVSNGPNRNLGGWFWLSQAVGWGKNGRRDRACDAPRGPGQGSCGVPAEADRLRSILEVESRSEASSRPDGWGTLVG